MPATTDRLSVAARSPTGGIPAASAKPSPVDIRPEGEILLHCAREKLSGEMALRVAELALAPLDWDVVFRLGVRHGTIPRLHRHLAATCAGLAPQAALTRLRSQYEYNSIRNLSHTRELIRLLGALETAGIETLAYKGPTLAVHMYGDLALRQFGDLDILVRPNDVARAVVQLVELGYEGAPWPRDAAGTANLARTHVHAMRNGNTNVEVELHWAFMPHEFSFVADLESWWTRMERRAFAGTSVRTLPAEELLVVLCAHGCRHLWVRLKSICDVAAVVGSEERLDWSRAFREAECSGARRMLALGLALARDLAGAELPPEVSLRVDSEPAVPALVGQVRDSLFDDDMCQPAYAAAQLFYLRVRERWRDKVSHGTRYLSRAVAEWRRGQPRPAMIGNRV